MPKARFAELPPPDDCNPSGNPSLWDLLDSAPNRRHWLRQGAAAWLTAWAGASPAVAAAPPTPPAPPAPSASGRLGFQPLAMTAGGAALQVPTGYTARLLYSWGDPVGMPGHMPELPPDASHSAADQARMAGKSRIRAA